MVKLFTVCNTILVNSYVVVWYKYPVQRCYFDQGGHYIITPGDGPYGDPNGHR